MRLSLFLTIYTTAWTCMTSYGWQVVRDSKSLKTPSDPDFPVSNLVSSVGGHLHSRDLVSLSSLFKFWIISAASATVVPTTLLKCRQERHVSGPLPPVQSRCYPRYVVGGQTSRLLLPLRALSSSRGRHLLPPQDQTSLLVRTWAHADTGSHDIIIIINNGKFNLTWHATALSDTYQT